MPSNYELHLKEEPFITLFSLTVPRNVFDTNREIDLIDYRLLDYSHDKKTGLFFMLNGYKDPEVLDENERAERFIKLEIIKPVNPDSFLKDYLDFSEHGKNFAKYSEFDRTIIIKSQYNRIELLSSNTFALKDVYAPKNDQTLSVFNFSGEKLKSFHTTLHHSVFPWVNSQCLALSTRNGKRGNKGEDTLVELRDLNNIEKVIKRFNFPPHLKPKALLPKSKQIILHNRDWKYFDIYDIFSNKCVAHTKFKIPHVYKTKVNEEESKIAFLITRYFSHHRFLKILVFNLPEYKLIETIKIKNRFIENNQRELLLSDMFDDILEKILDNKPISKSMGKLIDAEDNKQEFFVLEMTDGITKNSDKKLSDIGLFRLFLPEKIVGITKDLNTIENKI